jgi:transforming growth factor-beta-induced protein
MAQSVAPALNDAVDNGDGSYTNWFGTFTPDEGMISNTGWVDHMEHGRLWLNANGQNLWIYDPNVDALGLGNGGWIYTNRNIFPNFYVKKPGSNWLIFVSGVQGPEGTPRVFVDLFAGSNVYLPKATTDSIVDIAIGNEAFSTLVTAVSTAGLVDALSSEGPFTVFAPVNDAFAALGGDTINALLADTDALTNVLTYHVVPGRYPSGKLGLDLGAILKGEYISGYVQTLNGSDLRIDVTPFGILLNGDTMVTVPDIEGSNGIIHVIDQVLLPPKDIVDTAIDAGFNTLVAAVQAAGLESALRGDGPFTVFAPTDEAFAALGEETINALLADPDTLGNILLYHVVGAQVYSSEVMPGNVTMLNGDMASLSADDMGNLMIDGANIIVTDVQAANGVIHVIDAVITP